jgi:hypothetical protein
MAHLIIYTLFRLATNNKNHYHNMIVIMIAVSQRAAFHAGPICRSGWQPDLRSQSKCSRLYTFGVCFDADAKNALK